MTGRSQLLRLGLVHCLILCLFFAAAPAWAAEMITNGGFDTISGWTIGGTGTPQYTTAQNNGVLTGAGSFQEQVVGRNKSFTGTVSQAVSISTGAVINAPTDISLYAMETNNGFTSSSSVTVTLRYADATTVELFSGSVAAGSGWTQIANATATSFPITTTQNANQITVNVTSTVGNNASAQSDVFVDDITLTYTAAATDNLTVTSSVNVSTTAQPSQTDVQMMYMQLNSDAVGNGNCVVTDVTLHDVYIGATGTIAAVQVHMDDDNNFLNGTLGSNTVPTWDGLSTLVDLTSTDLTLAERTVTAGTPKFIWLLYNIEAGSATGIQSQLQVTDVGVLAPDNAPISGPWDSNIIDINTGLGCGGCHPNPMVDGVARDPLTGGVEGDHTKHASAQGYECELCHLATPANPRHRNSLVELRAAIGDVTNARYDKDADHVHDSSWDHTTTPDRGNCENTNCHGGVNSATSYGGPDGNGPLWGDTNTDTCTFCHNKDKGISTGAANGYPTAASPFRSATDVGAHAIHMTGTSGLFSGGVACDDCHTVPAAVTDAGHMDELAVPPYTQAPADVPLAGAAAALNSTTPSYDDVALTCVVYCHGANMPLGDTSGTNRPPVWTDDWTNYSTGCTDACHGLPPTAGSSSGTHSGVTYPNCNGCHGDTLSNNNNPPTVVASFHINGTVESSGCTGCHGTDPKEYPPLSKWGTDRNTADGVGAHVKHLEATAGVLTKEAIGGEADTTGYWCAECHTTTRGSGGHDDGYPAEIGFTNAIEAKYTGANGAVSYAFTAEGDANPDTGSGGSCVVYCHGADMPSMGTGGNGADTSPAWGATSTGCTFCHGAPPNSPAHSGSELMTDCVTCHPDTVNSSGGIASAANHINGVLEAAGDCDSCHGYPPDPSDGKTERAVEGKGEHVKHIAILLSRTGQTLDAANDTFTGANVALVCGACHNTSSDTNHSTGGGTRQILIPTSYQFGGSAPAYNGIENDPSATTPKTCSNVSCHFKTTPVWQ